MRNFLLMLFAAAALGLLPASGGSPADDLPADTLALLDGQRLLGEKQYDLARERLTESSHSGNIYIRAKSFLYLNALEVELENYAAARLRFEEYHVEAMQLFYRAMDRQQEMTEQMVRLDRRHKRLVNGLAGTAVLAFGAVVFFVWRRRAQHRHKTDPPPPDISDWSRYLVDVKLFKQMPIYTEIAELARQPRGRGARVLSLARQEELDRELAVRFANFTARLAGDHPALTAGDLKLCCLSLIGLSSFGRALCFGSTETNIVKQRKHKIKCKMDSTPNGRPDPRGTALFEFIFGDHNRNGHSEL